MSEAPPNASSSEGVTRLEGAVAVVTGGASGIGRALAERFAAEGARAVVVADRDAAGAEAVAVAIPGGVGVAIDVTDEEAVRESAERIDREVGPIDIWCSNAGIAGGPGLGDDATWDATFRVHVLAHVYVARHVLPLMLARGSGHIMITASAAGLLTEMDTAPYSVTKHGSVALAEWLAIQHGDAGINVSCLCPQAIHTAMTAGFGAESAVMAAGGFIQPTDVADAVVAAWSQGRFLILPHPQVAEFEQRRANDRDRWLKGMRRTWAKLQEYRHAH
jgi:NAD(P)-dependent dehydrogenase (short-subunit alcohol dehydrogenase family)